jgi:hypothetical protein
VVSSGVGAVFVTSTTALLVKSALVRDWFYHGQHVTASAVYGGELYASQDVQGYFIILIGFPIIGLLLGVFGAGVANPTPRLPNGGGPRLPPDRVHDGPSIPSVRVGAGAGGFAGGTREAQPPTRVPQLAQKRAPPGSSVPHSVQWVTAGASPWPQLMQNFASAGFEALQDAHTTAAAAGWAAGAG